MAALKYEMIAKTAGKQAIWAMQSDKPLAAKFIRALAQDWRAYRDRSRAMSLDQQPLESHFDYFLPVALERASAMSPPYSPHPAVLSFDIFAAIILSLTHQQADIAQLAEQLEMSVSPAEREVSAAVGKSVDNALLAQATIEPAPFITIGAVAAFVIVFVWMKQDFGEPQKALALGTAAALATAFVIWGFLNSKTDR